VQNKGERHRTIEQKVGHDIQITAEIGLLRRPRHGPVKTVRKAAGQKQNESESKKPPRHRRCAKHAQHQTDHRDAVRRCPPLRKDPPGPVQGRINDFAKGTVKHSSLS